MVRNIGIMTPSYEPNKVVHGDCREVLRDFPDSSIHCIVTSPPYWDLRNYTGGDEREIGRESLMHDYIEELTGVFSIAKPKLKDTGSVWVNIADTYRGGEPKMIPWLFMNKMLQKGWHLINIVIWYKVDAMAESTNRRLSQKWEPFFWFVKDPDIYYFNPEGAKMPVKVSSVQRLEHKFNQGKSQEVSRMKGMIGDMSKMADKYLEQGVNAGDVWAMPTNKEKVKHAAPYPIELCIRPITCCCPEGGVVFDPFAGSGTTGVTTAMLGFNRTFYGTDINPLSVEEANERIAPHVQQLSLF